MLFVIEFFLNIAFYTTFKNICIFMNYGFFIGKVFSTTLLFPILKISKTSLNIDILKKCFIKKIVLKILATEKFTFKIEKSIVVEYFPQKNRP